MTAAPSNTVAAAEAADYLRFAEGLADAAAAVTLPLFRQPLPVEVKADSSPFTQADCNSELAMTAQIEARYAQHGIIGEEYGSKRTDAEFVWVLDPIDGTRSFISGSRQYGTLIALLHRGEPIVGVLDFPALQERWCGVHVAEGGAATLNGAPCKVAAAVPPLSAAVAATTTVAVELDNAADARLQRFLPACGQLRLGGDSYAYAGVASGFLHLAIDYLMQPYDYLPLIPVIRAAGGVITDWEGAPLTPFADGGWKTALAAADATLHRQALDALAAAK